MKLSTNRLISITVVFLLILACTTVPVTQRKQLSLVPESLMLSTSFQQYQQFLQKHKLSDDQQKVEMVKRVGERIQQAVERYFAQEGLSYRLEGYKWEFSLVESPEANAWAMPGGKVVVYTGILPITRDEPGLAVVIGHEVAHAIARHGNERMSHLLLTQLAGMSLSQALSHKPQATRQLWMTAFGLGAQVGFLLPYSRLQESEADRLGLIFMAMAGYDPINAIDFWQRMAEKKEGQAPPEFLSTHPSSQSRIENIREMIPQARQYYRPADQ